MCAGQLLVGFPCLSPKSQRKEDEGRLDKENSCESGLGSLILEP